MEKEKIEDKKFLDEIAKDFDNNEFNKKKLL